jgi:hypothetical protein
MTTSQILLSAPSSVRKAFDCRVAPALADARPAATAEPPVAVTSFDVRMIVERITSDVLAALGEFVTPAGYGHLSLALSMRSTPSSHAIGLWSASSRTIARLRIQPVSHCRPVPSRAFASTGWTTSWTQAGTLHGEMLADRLFAGNRSRTAGRLKADFCVEAARRLRAVFITHIPDLCKRADDAEVRHAWTGVHGPGVGDLAVFLLSGRYRALQARRDADALCRGGTLAVCQPRRDRRPAVVRL